MWASGKNTDIPAKFIAASQLYLKITVSGTSHSRYNLSSCFAVESSCAENVLFKIPATSLHATIIPSLLWMWNVHTSIHMSLLCGQELIAPTMILEAWSSSNFNRIWSTSKRKILLETRDLFKNEQNWLFQCLSADPYRRRRIGTKARGKTAHHHRTNSRTLVETCLVEFSCRQLKYLSSTEFKSDQLTARFDSKWGLKSGHRQSWYPFLWIISRLHIGGRHAILFLSLAEKIDWNSCETIWNLQLVLICALFPIGIVGVQGPTRTDHSHQVPVPHT